MNGRGRILTRMRSSCQSTRLIKQFYTDEGKQTKLNRKTRTHRNIALA
jgi:hypothetical protein